MEKSPPFRTRYAPTPSGYLHLGNALNFLLTWVMAKEKGADILLRIDDLDMGRCRDEYIQDIFESLNWLDLEYHLGPQSVSDFHQNFSQHKRLDLYRQYRESIDEGLLYNCDCTRSSIVSKYPDGVYKGFCRERHLEAKSEKTAVRIKVDEDFQKWNVNLFDGMGDFVIWKKDNLPAYQLASLADDLDYKVNLIIRGEDLRASTAAQSYLGEQLKAKSFDRIEIAFHQLIKDEENKKMSKSIGASSLQDIRKRKQDKRFVFNEIANRLGIKDFGDINSKEEFYNYIIENKLNLLVL